MNKAFQDRSMRTTGQRAEEHPEAEAVQGRLTQPGSIADRYGPAEAGVILARSQVAMAFDALGDRWSAMILREIFLGTNRFEDLLTATSASRGILTKRLKALVLEGIVYRFPYSSRPVRYEYRLTRMGEGLYPTALMYWLWEKRYGPDRRLPSHLIHRSCGHSMLPKLICMHCRQPIEISGIGVEVLEGYDISPRAPRKRSSLHVSNKLRPHDDQTEAHVLDVIGDRWTALVQASAYFGLHRYADIQTALSIATNTLADRLRLLVRTGVFTRKAYQDNPPRYSYRLTEKGRALYLPAFTLHQWADRWLLRERKPPILLRHLDCGEQAQGMMVCDHCHDSIRLNEVIPAQQGS